MKRSGPLKRTGRLSRAMPVKRMNRKRRTASRARAYGPQDRIRWMQGLPCLICGTRPSEVAHIRTGGMGRKADASQTVPLCSTCHRFQHQKGWRLLCAMEFPMPALHKAAARYEAAWQRHQPTDPPREDPTR